MVKKYIVELESGTHIFILGPEGIVHIGEPDVVYETVDGMQIGDAVINAKPYTEPDLEQVRKEAYEKGYHAGYAKYLNLSYEDGLKDAWDAARKIALDKEDGGLDTVAYCEIFGYGKGFGTILKKFSASEAIEKIQQYEQEHEKKEKHHTWIFSEVNEPSVDTTLICSKCGYTITIKPGDTQALNFCPKCGDDKRGERDE
jgi:rubrerythrin